MACLFVSSGNKHYGAVTGFRAHAIGMKSKSQMCKTCREKVERGIGKAFRVLFEK